MWLLIIAAILHANIASGSYLDNFNQWFESSGGIASNISISEFGPSNRGIQCTTSLQQNSTVLKIPLELVLYTSPSHSNADHASISRLFSTQAEADHGLAAILLLEKYKIESSWKPYIDALPSYVGTSLYFTEAMLAELQNLMLINRIRSYRAQIVEAFPNFQNKCKQVFDSEITLQDFFWAMSILDSRALRFSGKLYLVPYADMFNFYPHNHARTANAGQFFLNYHVLSDKDVSILSDRDCVQGEQLFEDYGDSADDIYLLHHGFVPTSNTFRCIDISTPLTSTFTSQQKSVLLALDLKSATIATCVKADGVFRSDVWVTMITAAMNSDECAQCLTAVLEHKGDWRTILGKCGYSTAMDELKQFIGSKDDTTTTMSDLTKRALQLIQKWLPTASAFAFYGTIEDDESLLTRGQVSSEIELAIQYRLHHKRHFKHLCDKFRIPYVFPRNTKKTSTTTFHKFSDDTLDLGKKLKAFNTWFNDNAPLVNMIKAVPHPTYRIGVQATQSIAEGITYLGVPDIIIMDKFKAENESPLRELLVALKAKFGPPDSFHIMLFMLLYHRFILGSDSFYWPYLRLLPSIQELDVPGLWDNATITQRLYPSALSQSLLTENANTLKTFTFVSNMAEVIQFFSSQVFTYEHYAWAKTILNSRSIWWDGERHLVPLLDFINHGEGPDPKKIHSTTLDNTKRFAITNASWAFAKGEQVYENYGQPNHIYFTYHGFSYRMNSHDCVVYDLQLDEEEVAAIDWKSQEVLEIAQQIYMRNKRDIFTTCVSATKGLDRNGWMFLSLKLNNWQELKKSNILGLPNLSALQFMIAYTSWRIEKYDKYEELHHASSVFIYEEEALLKTIKDRMTSTVEHIERDLKAAKAKSSKTKKARKPSRESNDEDL